jgi:hypothetical protein
MVYLAFHKGCGGFLKSSERKTIESGKYSQMIQNNEAITKEEAVNPGLVNMLSGKQCDTYLTHCFKTPKRCK